MDDPTLTYFLTAAVGWAALQVVALWTLDGLWRKAAWVSAGAMALAIGIAVLGVLAGSNIAPIWIVLALPVCLLWIGALWVVRGLAWAIWR
jgi:uncharacterized membrane protein YvlD (DUF360 family)